MSLLAFLPPPSLHFLTPFPLRPFADSSPRLLSFHSCPFHPSWAGWLLWHPLVIPTRYFPDSFASSHHFGGRAQFHPWQGQMAGVAWTGLERRQWHSLANLSVRGTVGSSGVPTETQTNYVTIRHKSTKWKFQHIGVGNGEVLGPTVADLKQVHR